MQHEFGWIFPFFFFNDTATTEIYTLSLHDALPICSHEEQVIKNLLKRVNKEDPLKRSEEHTSELQSLRHLVCRLLLEKKQFGFHLNTVFKCISSSAVQCTFVANV